VLRNIARLNEIGSKEKSFYIIEWHKNGMQAVSFG